jgi:hypothetical protein
MQQPLSNPWREGEFLVHVEAKQMPDKKYAAYYWVDHHPEGGVLIGRVLEKRRFGSLMYSSSDTAQANAVSAGRQWVRENQSKVG